MVGMSNLPEAHSALHEADTRSSHSSSSPEEGTAMSGEEIRMSVGQG